jgi:5-formyltetrahydrofolate cyclo-ligase
MSADSTLNAGGPAGPALHGAKLAVRTRAIAARDALQAAERSAAAARIARSVIALPSFERARTVLLTLPFRGEWDTWPVVRAALAAGKTVALPRVDTAARMLVLHAVADPGRDIAPGYAGIPEPAASCPVLSPDAIDWVLVPGAAFDPAGRRLGYGGGFYDRLLPLLRPGVPRVAGAFEVQIVARVPAAAHDLAIGLIVTESRTITSPDA